MLRTWRRVAPPVVRWVLIAVLIVWSIIPILWNVLTSLKVRTQILEYPPVFIFLPSFDGYRQALTGPNAIYPHILNSVVVACGTTVASLCMAVLAAYAFSRYVFRGRQAIMFGLLATRLLPPISALVPLYLAASNLGLVDTHLVLIIIYTGLNIPFAAWLLKSYIDAVPVELEESAAIEGCGSLRIVQRITLPLITPGLLATGTFVFVQAWNEFMFAFMFTVARARTMPVILADSRGDETVLWQSLTAQATILILPAIALGLLLQKYLVKGLTAGAVK